MFATVPAWLTSTVNGRYMRPLARARCSSREIADCICGDFTFGAWTTTLAAIAVPGNAPCIRS